MTSFIGSAGNDVANAAIGELVGFTGGTVDELGDGLGDFLVGGDGEDFIFAGNANDVIEGGEHFDRLNGGDGNDEIYAYLETAPTASLIGDEILGNLGDDKLFGANGADTIDGGPGKDWLEGNGDADQLVGGDGDDILFSGGAGADTLLGGNGSDAILVRSVDMAKGEVIDGGGQSQLDQLRVIDSVNFTAAALVAGFGFLSMGIGAQATFTARQFDKMFDGPGAPHVAFPDFGTAAEETLRIEMRDVTTGVFGFSMSGASAGDRLLIVGDASSESIAGSLRIDWIVGNGGNDSLSGGGLLSGGTGDDILKGFGRDDMLIGGDGRDTLDWSSAAAAIVFVLPDSGDGLGPRVQGIGEDFFSGIENITAGASSDTITGNAFANALGGAGGRDRLAGGGGNDTLRGGDETGAGDILLAGGAGNDAIFGGGGNDGLDGGTGVDLLIGEAGDDTMLGGSEGDVLRGGAGRDRLDGGTGSDRFDYDGLGESSAGAARDIVQGFAVNPAAGAAFVDRLDFATLDAKAATGGNQAFVFIGAAAFSAEGQIRAVQTGAHTIVQANASGAAGAEMEVALSNFTAATLQSVDFIL